MPRPGKSAWEEQMLKQVVLERFVEGWVWCHWPQDLAAIVALAGPLFRRLTMTPLGRQYAVKHLNLTQVRENDAIYEYNIYVLLYDKYQHCCYQYSQCLSDWLKQYIIINQPVNTTLIGRDNTPSIWRDSEEFFIFSGEANGHSVLRTNWSSVVEGKSIVCHSKRWCNVSVEEGGEPVDCSLPFSCTFIWLSSRFELEILYTFVCISSYLLLRQSNEAVGKLTGMAEMALQLCTEPRNSRPTRTV